jgi:hypothetical protein
VRSPRRRVSSLPGRPRRTAFEKGGGRSPRRTCCASICHCWIGLIPLVETYDGFAGDPTIGAGPHTDWCRSSRLSKRGPSSITTKSPCARRTAFTRSSLDHVGSISTVLLKSRTPWRISRTWSVVIHSARSRNGCSFGSSVPALPTPRACWAQAWMPAAGVHLGTCGRRSRLATAERSLLRHDHWLHGEPRVHREGALVRRCERDL